MSSLENGRLSFPDKNLIRKDINRKFMPTKRYDSSCQDQSVNSKIALLYKQLINQNKTSDDLQTKCKEIVAIGKKQNEEIGNFAVHAS